MKDYWFIVDTSRVDQLIAPAMAEIRNEGTTSKFRNLMWQTARESRALAKVTTAQRFDRYVFIAGMVELFFWSAFKKEEAVRQANEIAPEVLERLCFVEITPGEKKLDIFRVWGSLEWLRERSPEFVKATYMRERLDFKYGEACEAYARPQLATMRREISSHLLGTSFEAQAKLLLSIIERVLSDNNLKLGLTVM